MSYSIVAVVKKGPFQAAGLRSGDRVHSIQNTKTKRTWFISSRADLNKFRTKCTPGQTYTVVYTKANETGSRSALLTPRKVAGKKSIGISFKPVVKVAKAPVAVPAAPVAKTPQKTGVDALASAVKVKQELKAAITENAKSSDGAMLRDHRAEAKVDTKKDAFLAQAKGEADEVNALMADMESARKYLEARKAKIQLEADIHAKVDEAGKKVNQFLGVDEAVVAAPKSRSRKLNLLGKFLVAATLLGGISTGVYYAAPRVMGYVASVRSAQ